ncbi:MAG: ABC transporter substrate-binding protein [Planctomycetes bacterium]|nr:ABC transporter substrate-binding protein [Planctomycetota bacterium]
MRALLVLLLVAVLIALGVFALTRTGGDAAGPSRPDGRVLAGVPQGHVYTSAAEEPADVNPLTFRGPAAQNLVLRVTHDALLDHDVRDGSVRGALAASYRVHDDGMGCDYLLRDGVTFSDGAALTAADVLFPWLLFRAGHLPMGRVADGLQHVASADVVDGERLVVRFRERHYAAPTLVGESWIVPRRAWFEAQVRARLDDGEAMPDVASRRFAELVGQLDRETGPGTGPYTMYADGSSQWHRRRHVQLARHEASWRRRARPGSWNFAAMRVLFRDQGGARHALLRGELDWYSGQDLDGLLAAHDQLAADYVRHVYDYPQLGVYRIVWNCREAPFDDARVRRALGMLVDRDAVVRRFPTMTAARSHAKPHAAASDGVPTPRFDVAAARAALRELGYHPENGAPLRVRLLALSGTDALAAIVALLRDATRQAGVELDVRERALAPFLAELKQGDWHGILVLESFLPSGDPHRFLHSQGTNNHGGFADARCDELAAAARVELDEAARDRLWSALHQRAAALEPATLVAHPRATVLLHRRLRGCEPGRFGIRPEWAWVPFALQQDG